MFSRPLMCLGYGTRQQECEGTWRSSHNRVVANAESISFYGGENTEREILTAEFAKVWKNQAFSFAARNALSSRRLSLSSTFLFTPTSFGLQVLSLSLRIRIKYW